MNIKSLPEDDRPREKLLARGAEALTEAELLAILIGSGSPGESAVALMQRLLHDCDGSLRRLGRMSVADLTNGNYKGLGQAKAITIIAASELGRRRASEAAEEKRFITTAVDIYSLMHSRMQDLPHEECYALYLRQDGSMEGEPCLISKGGLTSTSVDVRLVIREALMRRTPMLVLVHNHPSGNIRPSKEDDALTERVKHAAQLMNLRLTDHIIVTDGNYYSYREDGKI